MKNSKLQKALQKGSLMVEALAMLGLISIVTPVIYKKAAERTAEMQDINEAGHLRVMSRSFDTFLKSRYADLAVTSDAISQITDPTDIEEIIKFFPQGFSADQSKLFEGFEFWVEKRDETSEYPKRLTGFVVAKPKVDGAISRASRIASMIGTNGGVVKDNVVQGAQGVWELDADLLGSVEDGAVVASSIQGVIDSAGGDDLLYRRKQDNQLLNTMETTLYFLGAEGDNDIVGVNKLIGASVELKKKQDAGGATVSGTGDISAEGNATIGELLTAGTADIASGLFKVFGASTDATNPSSARVEIDGAPTASELPDGLAPDGVLQVGGTGIDTTSLTANTVETKVFGAEDLQGGQLTTDDTDDEKARTFSAVDDQVSVTDGTFNLVNSNLESPYFKLFTEPTAGSADGEPGVVTIGESLEVVFDEEGNMTTTSDIVAPYLIVRDDIAVLGNTDNTGNAIVRVTNDRVELGYRDSINTSDLEGSTGYDNVIVDKDGFAVNDSTYGVGSALLEVSADKQGEPALIFDTGTTGTDFKITGTDTETSNILSVYNDDGSTKILQVGGAYPATAKDTVILPGDNSLPHVYIRDGGIQVAGRIRDRHDTASGTYLQAIPEKFKAAGGYVAADILLSNTAFTDPYMLSGDPVERPSGDSDYANYPYHVNPAYTSVMHDIKLSSRGGARLSDILPDFITKGIYLTDNTFRDDIGGGEIFNWNTVSIPTHSRNLSTLTGQPASCNAADCETSPWLGFVPAPQCPPGYTRVATMAPLRFNMAKAYAVNFDSTGEPELAFITNPTSTTDYLAFQGSTWLNMSLQANNRDADGNIDSSQQFFGWHALMGFIYNAGDYEEYIKAKFGNDTWNDLRTKCSGNIDECIIWNLLPTYSQELASFTTTYCYFDRMNFYSHYIDRHYDQMTNFRASPGDPQYRGSAEDPGAAYQSYIKYLNDPNLEFTDEW